MDLATINEEIRRSQSQLDKTLVEFSAVALVLMTRLREEIRSFTGIAFLLSDLDTPWGEIAAQSLRVAIQQAEIRREDRKGKMLLALPDMTEESIRDWVRQMRLADSNLDVFIEANRYALERLKALTSVAIEVASTLVGNDDPQAKIWAERLREVAALQGRSAETKV